jgi:hypothetical protein
MPAEILAVLTKVCFGFPRIEVNIHRTGYDHMLTLSRALTNNVEQKLFLKTNSMSDCPEIPSSL